MLHPYYVYSQLGWRKILQEPSTENNTFKKKSESKQWLLYIGGKYLRIGNRTLRLVTRRFEHFYFEPGQRHWSLLDNGLRLAERVPEGTKSLLNERTNIHIRVTWVSRVKKATQRFYWLTTFFGFNRGQSYLATLVTPQNWTKMLRNLTLVVQFAYFSIRLSFCNFRYKKQLLIVYWATFEEITGNV